MPASIKDPKLQIRNTLQTEWNNANIPTNLSDADIHVGWFDGSKGYPQVSVTNVEESSFQGGVTGYGGFAGDGSGPIQHRQGTVLVNCWAGSVDDYSEAGLEKKQSNDMADEVERIIFANATAFDDFDSLSVTSTVEMHETNEDPVIHRTEVEVTYTYTKTPN